jgi:hypothetical protein
LDPIQTVSLWYDLIEADRYTEAAALWTERLRLELNPPELYLERRFARTTTIDINGIELIEFDEATGRALVGVDITEHREHGWPRRYQGAWELALVEDTWLLDVPHFQR